MGEHRIRALQAIHGRPGGLVGGGLLDLLADDVEWRVLGNPAELPWAGTFRGRDAVRDWFAQLGRHMEYLRFQPLEWLADADADTVVEVISAAGRARATGLPFESEIVRIWRFRGDRVVLVRSYYDTASYRAALLG